MKVIWALLVIAAGALMSLMHPFRVGGLAWEPGFIHFLLSSLGLGLFMKITSLRKSGALRFFLGFLGGFVFFSIVLYWIFIALREFGDVPLVISVLGTVALSGYCALYFGLWSWMSGLAAIRDKSLITRMILWASLWASLGAIRETLFTGFGWGEIGYHFSNFPWIGRTASLWGVHGLSFFWILLVSVVIHFDECWRNLRLRVATVIGLVLFLGAVLWSWLEWEHIKDSDQKLKVALIQPNIDQALKWSPDRATEILQRLVSMTAEASKATPDLIVWPETSYPFLVSGNQRQLPFSSEIPLIVGAVISDRGINKNAALLVHKDQILGHFEKIHLVPFGEFVPFEDYLPFEKLVANVGRFKPGSEDQQPLLAIDNKLRMGLLICYEDAFAQHSVRHVSRGANLLVNITNDAWYGFSSALSQHAAMARLQTYSTLTPMIRSTNTGLTSLVTPDFREDFPIYVEDIHFVDVPLPKGDGTFFVRTFPLMRWIWCFIFGIALLWKSRNPRKKIFFRK